MGHLSKMVLIQRHLFSLMTLESMKATEVHLLQESWRLTKAQR
jgi:hypothetical protein